VEKLKINLSILMGANNSEMSLEWHFESLVPCNGKESLAHFAGRKSTIFFCLSTVFSMTYIKQYRSQMLAFARVADALRRATSPGAGSCGLTVLLMARENESRTRAGVTQLVECNLAKVDVAGSNPVSRSNSFRNI
jgi:hypothetical protein